MPPEGLFWGVFPAGLLVGQVAQGPDRRLRVILAADYSRLDYLRVLRSRPVERIEESDALVGTVHDGPQPAEASEPGAATAEAGADG